MTCVSADARITPGCAGLWTDEQGAAWKRVVDLVHGSSGAKIGIQLGHAGRKGSTQLGWQKMDEPLAEGNWPLVSASALPYGAHSQTPREMSTDDMARITADFVAATRRAAAAVAIVLEFEGRSSRADYQPERTTSMYWSISASGTDIGPNPPRGHARTRFG